MAKMLADGSNPEGVDPEPPVNWSSKEDLKDVVVYGSPKSPPVVSILAFLIVHNIPYKHVNGKKKGTPYPKMPVLDVAGRQVNDSGIILKYLVPALGEEFNPEWGEKINKVLDTTFRGKLTKPDAIKVGASFGIPKCCGACCVAGILVKKLHKVAQDKVDSNQGYKIGDQIEIAKEFNAALSANKETGPTPFFGGAEPNAVDISLYGFMVPLVICDTDFTGSMLTEGGLQEWFNNMKQKVPFEKLFGKK